MKNITFERVMMVVLAAIVIYLLFKECGDGSGPGTGASVEKETTTTQTIDIVKTIDQAVNNALANQKPERTPYIIIRDEKTGKETVIEVKDTSKLNAGDLSNVKELNTYKDTTRLKNATIYSRIVSDGKVYLNDVTAIVDEKTITNTTTEKTTIHGSGLFVKGGAFFSKDVINNSQVMLGLEYIRKNDVGFGAGVLYHVPTKEAYIGFTLSKKLF